MKKKSLVAVVLMLLWPAAHAASMAYDLLNASKTCKQSFETDGIECDYRAGSSVHVGIAGVGAADVGITVFKSDFDNGDYYVRFAPAHGCIIVASKTNMLSDYAFISPKNGKVYRTWQDCRDQK